MTNLYNHQANKRVSAAVSPTIVLRISLTSKVDEPTGCKSSATQCRLWLLVG